jgi:hypothetical protein
VITKVTELDEALLKKMTYIVQAEYRPFSYKDFKLFAIDGHCYSASHGTCRNKFSQFVKWGIIEKVYNSKVSFYTLKGHYFGSRNAMTGNHMGISSVIPVIGVTGIEMDKLFDYLHTVPSYEASVHDIHFKFVVNEIYKTMSSSRKYENLVKRESYDIILTPEIIDGLKIQSIVHRTDTVTISVACSTMPIPINEEGILQLSCALTRAEERLSFMLYECINKLIVENNKPSIPDNRKWIVTMWHFGKDKKFEFNREGYSLTWGYGREVLRIYTKSVQGEKIERTEHQEYPNRTFGDAVAAKLVGTMDGKV